MKAFLLLPILSLPLLLTGCDVAVVDHQPRRVGYVERDYRYNERDSRDYRYGQRQYRDERTVAVVNPRVRRNVVVVNPRSAYRPQVEVRYYSDSRGRYYIRDGRRVYSNAGVRY